MCVSRNARYLLTYFVSMYVRCSWAIRAQSRWSTKPSWVVEMLVPSHCQKDAWWQLEPSQAWTSRWSSEAGSWGRVRRCLSWLDDVLERRLDVRSSSVSAPVSTASHHRSLAPLSDIYPRGLAGVTRGTTSSSVLFWAQNVGFFIWFHGYLHGSDLLQLHGFFITSLYVDLERSKMKLKDMNKLKLFLVVTLLRVVPLIQLRTTVF